MTDIPKDFGMCSQDQTSECIDECKELRQCLKAQIYSM